MNKQLAVSVIIPVYNVEKYIKQALESVLFQSLETIEIICVDDCSTDASADIIMSFAEKDNRVVYLKNESNSGPSVSRNRGLRIAKGEYIFFLDSDDTIEPSALEELYGIASQGKYPLVYFDYRSVYESEEVRMQLFGRYNERKKSYEGVWTGEALFEELVNYMDMPGTIWSQFYAKEFLLENDLLFQDGILHEDLPYIVKATLLADRVYYTDKKFYNWYHRKNSITTSATGVEHIEGRVKGYLDLLSFWEKVKLGKAAQKALSKYLSFLLKMLQRRYTEVSEPENFFLQEPYYRFILDILVHPLKDNKPIPRVLEAQRKIINESEKMIIYGAGKIAKNFLDTQRDYKGEIIGFAVTSKDENVDYLCGHKVYEISDLLNYRNGCLVVIAVSVKFQEEIKSNLHRLGFENILTWEYQ